MEFRAQTRFVRVSPQKARLVLDLIKGKRVEDALTTLTFTKKRIATDVLALLRSAVQNADYLSQEKGFDVDVDRLYVKAAVANDGPRMKRIRPAPMGRCRGSDACVPAQGDGPFVGSTVPAKLPPTSVRLPAASY